MWWWQSVALAGALSFGASVPADHLTDCAAAGRAEPATSAAADAAFRTSRRLQSEVIASSSPPRHSSACAGSLAREEIERRRACVPDGRRGLSWRPHALPLARLSGAIRARLERVA